VAEKLSGRPETYHGQSTEASDHVELAVHFHPPASRGGTLADDAPQFGTAPASVLPHE
jgi:hypothetical protein